MRLPNLGILTANNRIRELSEFRIFAAEDAILRDILGTDAGHTMEDLGGDVVHVLSGIDVSGAPAR